MKFATAECTAFSRGSDDPISLKCRVFKASLTTFPRTKLAILRILKGETRINLATALASIIDLQNDLIKL
jgi:hypothetical protein